MTAVATLLAGIRAQSDGLTDLCADMVEKAHILRADMVAALGGGE